VEARLFLKNFTNQVERELPPGRALHDINDCASKVGENAVRLAGLFHYYEGIEGPITTNTIERAIAICEWHMLEFIRIFREPPEMPLEIQDAMAVEKFLTDRLSTFPRANMVLKSYLLTHGPTTIRKKARLDLALNVLSSQGKISVQRENKKSWVHWNPQFFAAAKPSSFQPNYAQHLSPVLPSVISPGLGFSSTSQPYDQYK
jgi:hypothetical protein